LADVLLTVCSTCRPDGAPEDAERPGAALGRAVRDVAAAQDPDGRVQVRAIACLSACTRACSATVSAPGKFGYVVGNLSLEDADALVAFALGHARSVDGIPPWRERPEKIRKNTIARLPPADAPHALIQDVAD
jgi:predicted metal-binding protein